MTKKTYRQLLKKYTVYKLQCDLLNKEPDLHEIHDDCVKECTRCPNEIKNIKEWELTGLCEITGKTPAYLYRRFFCEHAVVYDKALE